MSRNCEECENFGGWDFSDGTPFCGIEGGFMACPHNDDMNEASNDAQKQPFDLRLDTNLLTDYIRETIQNTIKREAHNIAVQEIKNIVTEAYKDKIRELTQIAIEKTVDAQVAEFMSGDITLGGGWSGPSRTISRSEYLTELIEEHLKERFEKGGIKKDAESIAKQAIDNFSKQTRNEINAGVKQYFDAATRQILTENVVSMLMSNDTYKRLSDSMGCLLSDGK